MIRSRTSVKANLLGMAVELGAVGALVLFLKALSIILSIPGAR